MITIGVDDTVLQNLFIVLRTGALQDNTDTFGWYLQTTTYKATMGGYSPGPMAIYGVIYPDTEGQKEPPWAEFHFHLTDDGKLNLATLNVKMAASGGEFAFYNVHSSDLQDAAAIWSALKGRYDQLQDAKAYTPSAQWAADGILLRGFLGDPRVYKPSGSSKPKQTESTSTSS
jgi:hypothetical protein